MRTQAGAGIEHGRVEKRRREEAAFVALEDIVADTEAGGRQSGQNAIAIDATRLFHLTAAGPSRHRNLEIDVFRKPLDQIPSLGQRGAAAESRRRPVMVEHRQHFERARDMPILLDQSGSGAEALGESFNEGLVQHVHTSVENRCS